MGTYWRDEHGHLFRVFSTHWTDDPQITLRYIPPGTKTITLSELRSSHEEVGGAL